MKISFDFIFALLAVISSIHYCLAASASIKNDLAKEALAEEIENAGEEDNEPQNKLLYLIEEDNDRADLESNADKEMDDKNDSNNYDDIHGDLILNADEENDLQDFDDQNKLNKINDEYDELVEVEEGRARRRSKRRHRNRKRQNKNRRRRGRKNQKNRRGRRHRRRFKRYE